MLTSSIVDVQIFRYNPPTQRASRLAPGSAYEIQSPLGAGGMGEVYRARDTKLGRQVAVKILPDDFVKDPARVARFQREAQALAALNHPHIAQIYGFDDTSDVHALVMELVDGPTLADRIAQGPILLDEALPIAHHLAEALEAAHEQGIIHRDLKPANIKVRPDGTVKVLFNQAVSPDGQPWFLPDGRHFLYRAISGVPGRPATVYAGSLDDAPSVAVGESDSKAIYVVFSGSRKQPVLNLYQKAADGSGPETPLLEGEDNINRYVTSWSTDGRHLLYHTGAGGSKTGNDLWVLGVSDGSGPRALLQTSFNEVDGQFSPDGRWVAYVSNESGRNEIFVMPFRAGGGKWQISTAGGSYPRWRRDGNELFYLEGNAMMAVAVNGTGAAFEVGAVQRLFEVSRRVRNYNSAAHSAGNLGMGRVFDVAGDGQRFLVNVVVEEDQTTTPPITVITNWTATLR